MPLSADDRLAIHELLSQQYYLLAESRIEEYGLLFTENMVIEFDNEGLQLPSIRGRDAMVNLLQAGGALLHAFEHHVTDVMVTAIDDDTAHVKYRDLALAVDGSIVSTIHECQVVRTATGWQIARRGRSAGRAWPSSALVDLSRDEA